MNMRKALTAAALALSAALAVSSQTRKPADRVFLEPHHYFAGSLAYDPSGRHVVYSGPDYQVVVAEANSGRKARELRGHTNEVTAIAFSPDRRELASAATDGAVRLWDWESGRLRHSLTLPGRVTAVFGIAYSPRGDKIADIRSDSLVSVWDAASGRLLLSGESGLKHLGAVTFSSGGGELIVGGESEGGKGGLEVWRLRGGTGPSRTPLPARVTALALTPRGDELLVGDSSGAMRILDWKAGRLKSSWQAHDGPIREVKLDPGGGRFVTVVSWEEPGVKLWSVSNPAAVLRKFSTEEEGATSMSFSPNGGELAAIGRDNKIRFWAVSDGRLIRSINVP